MLELNEVGRLTFRCTEPLLVDDYTTNRSTGSFIIIDPTTNATVGAGVIRVIATAHASPERGASRERPAVASGPLRCAGHVGSDAAVHGPVRSRQVDAWPPPWKRLSCAQADPPSCSTGTICATG